MAYQLIYADPAWTYADKNTNGQRGAGCKYDLMTTDQIAAMPVAEHVADDAVLAMWATWPLLADALAVMEAWGFEYRTCAFVWVKTRTTNRQAAAFRKLVGSLGLGRTLTKRMVGLLWPKVEPMVMPTVHVGLGHHTSGNTEVVLLGVRGKGLERANKGVRQVVHAPLREHSRKPNAVRDALVHLPVIDDSAERPCRPIPALLVVDVPPARLLLTPWPRPTGSPSPMPSTPGRRTRHALRR